MKPFEPDYQHVVDAAYNREPKRLPLYEHIVNIGSMEAVLGEKFGLLAAGNAADKREFFRRYTGFWRSMGYDTVSYECGIGGLINGGRSITGKEPGPIQNRADFERYPFDGLIERYFERYTPLFDALTDVMPAGMKLIGGVGNGVFEIAQECVRFTELCMIKADDPALYADLFRKIGDVMYTIWSRVLDRYGDSICVARFGDDLGFKKATLLSPDDIREHIIPQYRRIVDLVHSHGKPFLLHSCGNLLGVFDDIIREAGIDAKHSNEDEIAPFSTWVNNYGKRIGNFGGVDLNVLVLKSEPEIQAYVRNTLTLAKGNGGMAIGSGNSIPEYVPAAGYLAMVNAVRDWRGDFNERT
ncbi:MAG: uroporphyrinogen decarboxylase family protein [Spirochaetota bacterium]